MVKLNLKGLSDRQKECVAELSKIIPISLSADGYSFDVAMQGDCISIKWDGKEGSVTYGAPHQFSRCVGLVYEKLSKSAAAFEINEKPQYDMLGYMFDYSRNGISNMETFKDLTKRLALMGYSMIQLYTEDTYELPEYPYFGYMRPMLKKEDIKEMDAYARIFDIDLAAAIQTLAHLNQFLKWHASAPLRDIDNILLVGSEETYKFIEAQFKTVSECYTCRDINIGLDEAHNLGLGKYLAQHGLRDKTEIIVEHCERVFELARKYGLRPMMWGDPFCGFAYTRFGASADIPDLSKTAFKNFPEDVSLLNWDYFSQDSDFVQEMMDRYTNITPNVIFAPGAWKWTGFFPFNRFSFRVGKIQHDVCVKNNIRKLLLTTWGNNGCLASNYCIMPTVQYWAELCYRNGDEGIRDRFRTCMDGDFDEFYDLDMTNVTPDVGSLFDGHDNPGLYIFYQDILMGLFDKHVGPEYKAHFAEWAKKYAVLAKKNDKWASLFEIQRDLCRVLELKCNMGIDLYNAYNKGDKKTMKHIAKKILPELIRRMNAFYKTFSKQWYRENQVIGLDSFDLKFGGVLKRLEVAKGRLEAYLKGEVSSMPEFERERLNFNNNINPNGVSLCVESWIPTVTANYLV